MKKFVYIFLYKFFNKNDLLHGSNIFLNRYFNLFFTGINFNKYFTKKLFWSAKILIKYYFK